MSTISASTTSTTAYKVTADTTGALVLQTGTTPTTAVTIDTGQRTTFPTTIAIGNAAPSTSGSGITFPATQSASSDANTLDDYEEGTWTPVITGASTAGSATYTTQAGTYVKIGKYVFLQLFVTFSSTHTGTGTAKLGGFPFTTGADYGGGGTITYKTAWVTNGPDFMQGEANTTFGYLRYDNNTGQADIVPNVNIQNTTSFMMSIWYLASA